jgi:signal transduction histidine kinase
VNPQHSPETAMMTSTSLHHPHAGTSQPAGGEDATRHGRRTLRLTLAGFACSLGVMAMLSVLAFLQVRTFGHLAEEISRSQEILLRLEHLRAALSGAETSQRGYLITGSSSHLEPYHQAQARARADLQTLASDLAGHPRQSALAAELRDALEARFQTFEGVIAVYDSHGFRAAQALVKENSGRRQTEQAHSLIDGIGTLILAQLNDHRVQQETAENRLRNSVAALAIVLLFVLSLLYQLASRSVAASRRAQQLLNKLNASLEHRVFERTEQLGQRTLELEQRSRQLEERSAQLEKTNQQLESFSYSVSHDLRAPLRAISGFSQILARRHRLGLDEEGRHFLDNIVKASAHMGQLIDDLLSYSRLGRKAVTLKPVALTQVMDSVRLALEPRVTETGATLSIAQDLPGVSGNDTLLRQIFTNLVDNALTYRKPGIPAQISVQWRRNDDGQVVVSVTDNGIGIAAEHFSGIFNVFQRLHGQDDYPGTGIGLAVVQRAAEMQGGRVWVDSTPGVGSTFHVQLPAAGA